MSDETGDVAARGGRDRLLTLVAADLRALDPPDDDGYALLQVYIKDCDVDDFTSCLPDCVGLVGYGEAFMGCRGLVRRQHLHLRDICTVKQFPLINTMERTFLF